MNDALLISGYAFNITILAGLLFIFKGYEYKVNNEYCTLKLPRILWILIVLWSLIPFFGGLLSSHVLCYKTQPYYLMYPKTKAYYIAHIKSWITKITKWLLTEI